MGPEFWGIDLAQSWAEAVGALGTALAFVVAAFVYRRAESDRRERHADQARLVFFVTERNPTGVRVLVRNLSTAPVYFVASAVQVQPGTGPTAETGRLAEVLPPDHVGEEVWSRMAPTMLDERGKVKVTGPVAQLERVTIGFLDAHGRQWRRAGNEQPRLVRRAGLLERLRAAVTSRRSISDD